MTTTTQPPTQIVTYLRSDRPMSATDRRQLKQYLEGLRQYYEIPADQPVFPRRTTKPNTNEMKATPSKSARNSVQHPWKRSWRRP